MKNNKIRNLDDFRLWVKIRMVETKTTQRMLAKRMGIAQARISEALNGKQSGNKHIVPIIKELGGNLNDFKEFLKAI